jgi:hypothetical protein
LTDLSNEKVNLDQYKLEVLRKITPSEYMTIEQEAIEID